MVELYHLCAPEITRHQVSHVTPLLVAATPSHFSRTTARRTTWTATFTKKTLYTQNNFLKSPYQKLQQTQFGRKAAPKTLSHPNYESAGNLRNNTPTGYEPNVLSTGRNCYNSDDLFLRYLSIFRCSERIWRTKLNKLHQWKK